MSSREPSMEDILASIKKVIAEEKQIRSSSPGATRDARDPHGDHDNVLAGLDGDEPLDITFETEVDDEELELGAMDELVELAADEQDAAPAAAPAGPSEDDGTDDEEDTLELGPAMTASRPAPLPATAPPGSRRAINPAAGLSPMGAGDGAAGPAPARSVAPADPAPAPIAAPTATPTIPPRPAPAPAAMAAPSDTLLDDAVAQGSRAILAELSGLAAAPPPKPSTGNPFEDLVRDMLRPMLKAWLDDHLPEIVEAHVRREVARITGRDL